MKTSATQWFKTNGGKLQFSPTFNAAALFIHRHLEEGRSQKAAIRTLTQTITYATLAEQVNRFGNALLEHGLRPGDRILLIAKDGPEFCYLFWGAIKAGMVAIPLNALQRTETFAHVMQDSQCQAVVYSPEYAHEVLPAVEICRPWALLAFPMEGKGSLQEQAQSASADLALFPSHAEDVCFWLYSSGTTGLPKGVMHTHGALANVCHWVGTHAFGFREEDVYCSISKLFFAYGLCFAMGFPFWMGGTAILDERRPTPAIVLEWMQRFRPTVFSGVPTFFASMLQELEGQTPDFSHLRICCSAGEPLPGDLLHRWQKQTGMPLLDGIGATENLSHYITNTVADYRPHCSGRVIAGYEAKICNEAGHEVPLGEKGTLWVKSPSTAKGYWNQPEKNKTTFVEGWLRTGDSFSQDEAGYFYYQGRNDDLLKVGGVFVSPFQIEAALTQHPKVLEVAVAGVPDAQNLIKPKAWVVLNDPAEKKEALKEELRTHCKNDLAPYMTPRWIEFIEELPKTTTGKIRRFLLREKG